MLKATKSSMWRKRYDISVDGRPVVTWDPSAWLSGGTLQVEGRLYRVRVKILGSTYAMESEDGAAVASARRVGRKRWTIEAAGSTYQFRRSSFWNQNQELVSGDERAGYVRRTGFWRNEAEADLPGMPLPTQVFAVVVVLTMWVRATSVTATGSGG